MNIPLTIIPALRLLEILECIVNISKLRQTIGRFIQKISHASFFARKTAVVDRPFVLYLSSYPFGIENWDNGYCPSSAPDLFLSESLERACVIVRQTCRVVIPRDNDMSM